jgi:DNA mismatch endonuclease, patch repair protein
MARIRSKNTSPEKILRSALWRSGLRYRLHFLTTTGRPDIVFPTQKIAIFIDGCFWHGCPEHYVFPRTRREFWSKKMKANVERDQRQTRELAEKGWIVLRMWEHEIYEDLDGVVERIRAALKDPNIATSPGWRVGCVEVVNPEIDLERRQLVTVTEPLQNRVEERVRTTAKSKPPHGWGKT